MSTLDVYRITDRLDEPTLEVVVKRLEARGKHPRFIAMMEQYFQAMHIDSAKSVLDVGCGTGVAARAIAQRPKFAGHITAIDLSPYLVRTATLLSEKDGVARTIEFHTGDSQSLRLPDGAFDAAVAHTLVSHVDDPRAVLQEIARVVRPGGMVGIFDGDYASLTFGSSDAERGKADDEVIINAVVTNPRVMRQLPELLRDTGFELVTSQAHVVADIGKADFWTPGIESFVRLLPKAGAMSETQAQAWAESMFKRSTEGIFFGASNYYGYVAQRT